MERPLSDRGKGGEAVAGHRGDSGVLWEEARGGDQAIRGLHGGRDNSWESAGVRGRRAVKECGGMVGSGLDEETRDRDKVR